MSEKGNISILLDTEPLHVFKPGDAVSGRVIIRPKDTIRSKGLLLTLSGHVKVKFKCGGNRRFGEMELFVISKFVLGDGLTFISIPPGDSSHTFSFALPQKQFPPSFTSPSGRIEYLVQARLNTNGQCSLSWKKAQAILVLPMVNLSVSFPVSSHPKELTSVKKFGWRFCKDGPLKMVGSLKSAGFYPGEYIPFKLELYNSCSKVIRNITAHLVVAVHCISRDGHNDFMENSLVSIGRGWGTPAHENDTWEGKLKLPLHLPPSIYLPFIPIIRYGYLLKLEANLSGGCTFSSKDPYILLPIYIGSRGQGK